MKITHPVTRAAFGIAALAIIAVSANWLVSLTPLGNRGADFTEKKIHTLSGGTKAILGELDTPVTLRYYATRNSDYLPEELKIYMRRVDDLLKEYTNLSHGKLRVEHLDPEPDTDAEDSANLDGISGQRMNDDNLYFGIAVSCLDKTSVIPFLDPRDETMLEYNLSRAISEVSTPVKPKLGIMSGIPLTGGPPNAPGQRPSPPWMLYQQLQQAYDVVDLSMEDPAIDPKEIKALLVFHPANIQPAAEYAIDQYLLQGGTVVACLDAFSVTAQMTGGGNPMMGMPGIPTTSTLPTLLSAWGIEFENKEVLADAELGTDIQGRIASPVLTFSQANMPQKESVITKDLESLTFLLPGAYTIKGVQGVATTTLLRSSNRAGFVDSALASQLDPSLSRSLEPTGKVYPMAVYLSGKFPSAFPEGKPGATPEPEPATENADDQAAAKEDKKPESLKEATAAGNVFLISDIDAFYDRFAYDTRLSGLGIVTPTNGNAPFLLNILDQAIGSKYLIGARSRSAQHRPFTVVQKMEDDFDKSVGEQIKEFEAKQQAAQERLNELQAQKARGKELYLSPEQEAEIRKIREEQVKYSKLIRDAQKDLRRQKDKLAGKITKLNVVTVPLFVVLLGLGLYVKRRFSTRAR